MLNLNWSGMKRIYWMPFCKCNGDGKLWYVEVKFLVFQLSVYSVAMANAMIDTINNNKSEN